MKYSAAGGELTALVSGSREVLDEQRDLLEAMAKTVLYVGGLGTSAALKLGNNQLLGLVLAGIGESLRSTDAAGVDRVLALNLFTGTVGRVAEMKRKAIAERDFTPHFSLAALVKDLREARDAAAAAGLELRLLQQTCAVYEQALANGKGALDFSAIVDSTA